MDFYEAVSKRRSVREFVREEIPEETLKRIIGAAFRAPTNDHMRDWHYIIVRDRTVTAKLLDIIPKGISDADMDALIRDWNLSDSVQQACYRSAVPKQHRMLFDASAVIIPLFKQKTDILHPENLSHLNGFASIWCSIEHIFLAAAAEGYGCNLRVPLGDEAEYARTVLGFPAEYCMPCFIGIGRPEDGIAPVPQKEIDLSERIHWDKF
ncbi:MAG: nitroreductase family protein [Oscillospiraceae bacterium]|nr:nitroreductase family protein [Oscillospiraceae bacterium]